VLKLVLGHGLTYAVAGLVAGTVAALLLSRIIASQLYGVSAIDPVTYIASDARVLVVTAVATLVPALRATGVDLVVALRSE
jgi:ABC-type antimicrobial peptide transport system permease subunit